jgi:hypothetical protein
MSFADSNPFSISIVAASTAPAWFTAMADKTWTSIATGTGSGFSSGNTLNQARVIPEPGGTSPAPNVTSYGGAGVDQTRGELLVYGGGHGSYSGNEVYALALRTATPGWVALNQPSPGAFNNGPATANDNGQYAGDVGVNQAPRASHSSRLVFANGRLWAFVLWGVESTDNNAYGTSASFYFDRAALQWHSIGRILTDAEFNGNYQGQFAQGTPAIYVAEDGLIWCGFQAITGSGVPSLFKIDVSTLSYTKYTNNQSSGFWSSGGAGIGNHLVLLWSPNIQFAGPGLFLFNGSSPTSPYAPPLLTVNNTSGLGLPSEIWGGVYHAPSNAVLLSDGNNENFIKATVPADPLNGTWNLTAVTPSNTSNPNRIKPTNPTSYTYSRWNLINDMGNGQGAIVFLPDNGAIQPVYVFKLPAAGV